MTDDLKTKTVTQLIQLCKQNQITGYSKKKKCDLIDMLTKKTEDTQKEATTEQNNSVKECCICYDSIPVSTLFALVPCGHRCVCSECVKKIVSGNITKRKCPLCRKRVKEAIVVYD